MSEIREIRPGGDLRDFLDVVDRIYDGDRNFVRPLDQDLKERLSPKKNPFFEHGEATYFTAHKGGQCVGRISATIDREHLARHKDECGFWGFLDTIDDEDVAKDLIKAAEGWLRGKAMKHVRGPVSLNVNEEVGCLIDGFDTPPYILMPHHRPYQAGLIEKAGYGKVKDLYAWSYVVGEPNARVKKAHDDIKGMKEVVARPVSYKDME